MNEQTYQATIGILSNKLAVASAQAAQFEALYELEQGDKQAAQKEQKKMLERLNHMVAVLEYDSALEELFNETAEKMRKEQEDELEKF